MTSGDGISACWVCQLPPLDEALGTHPTSPPDAGDVDLVVREMIAAWLVDQPLDAVVWTALPSRGPDGDLERPHFDRVLSHLKSLEGAARARAEEYIRRTPRLVRTHHRMCFEEILGWVPTEGGR